MREDDQAKQPGQGYVLRLAERSHRGEVCDWVQAIPGMPVLDVLEETSQILDCVTHLARQALRKPSEAKPLLQATCYLGSMAKVMLEGQLPR